MANVKISELSAGSAMDGTEKIAEVQSGSTVYGLISQIVTFVFSTTRSLIPTNGASANFKVATTTLADVSSDATANSLVPAGVILLALTTYVTDTITGSGVTGYTVGDGSNADRWGDITGTAIGTTSDNSDWTDGTLFVSSATDVVISATGGSFTAGGVEIVVHYIDSTAPTS